MYAIKLKVIIIVITLMLIPVFTILGEKMNSIVCVPFGINIPLNR